MSQSNPDQRMLLSRALRTLDELQARLDAVEKPLREPIAVVGVGCRFPRGGNDPEGFWQNLRTGVDCIAEVPRERWEVDELYDPEPGKPGKVYTRHGGFLDRAVDGFDPHFFGIAPREALSMDPQQRLLLEVTWEALEHAGQAPSPLAGSATGVFIGIGSNDYCQLQSRSGNTDFIDAYFGAGVSHSIASGRLSYVLGLQGPCVSVDTACSSSLVAVHLACQSLRLNECRMALAGGVSLMLAPDGTLATCQARMLSPDGRCKTFDASADGYVRAEGCGIVVLKRLSDAQADGDVILALIRSSAINQDGRSSGITAPNGPAQEAVIREALARAGVAPHSIQYVETHGTGTSLGDPIEVQALGAVLCEGRPADRPLLIGGVKTNIGHLEAAAGIAGLIKMVLAFHHGVIPPHLHFHTPNPHIPWEKWPIRVLTEAAPWPRTDGRRLAGVSSFGFSGTNAHVILEEAPASAPAPVAGDERPAHLLTLSAKSAPALQALAERYVTYLAAHPEQAWADVCFTANAGRAHFPHRLAMVAESTEAAQAALAAAGKGEAVPAIIAGVRPDRRPPLALLCTGQGAQYVGMGRELYQTQPVFRQALDRCAAALRPHLEHPLLGVMWGEAGPAGGLDQTGYTQPALFALEVALAELWRSWGVTPTWVLGHSVGEVVAAVVAGVLSLEDGCTLIAARAQGMQALPSDGAMLAVRASAAEIAPYLAPVAAEVALAAVNGPASVVLSGRRTAVAQVQQALAAAGVSTTPLAVSHAFHSPLMEPMLAAFEQVAAGLTYRAPQIGLISNLTGQPLRPGELDAAYWRRHVREAVQFQAGMATLQAQGATLFLEVGPAPVLCGLGQACLPAGTGTWLPSLRKGRGDWATLLPTLAALYVRGVPIDWAAFDRPYPRRKVSLPTYPFQRERYWLAAAARGARAHGGTPATPALLHPLLGHRVRAAHRDRLFENQVGGGATAYLRDHAFYGQPVLPATAYLEIALAAGAQQGSGNVALADVRIEQPLFLPEGTPPTVQCVVSEEGTFEIASLDDEAEARWRRHAAGRVTRVQESPTATDTLAEARARCRQPLEVEAYYARFRAVGVEYGPAFRGIEAVWSGDGEAVGRLTIPEAAGDTQGYRVHPVLLDAGFQLLGAAYGRRASGDAVYMPTTLARCTVTGEVGRRAWAHTVVQAAPGEAASLTGEIRLFDEAGRLVAAVEGLELRHVTKQALARTQPKPYLDWLYEVNWEEQALTGEAPARPQPGQWVVFAEPGAVGERLVDRLRTQGHRVETVRAGAGYRAQGDGQYAVAPNRPEDFETLCRTLGAGEWGVVYLWPLGETAPDAAVALPSQQRLLGGALHLVQGLLRTKTSARLYLVTRGAQAVGEAPEVAPAQAALWGLGRTVALEHPELACVRVDLEPGNEQDAEALVAEFGAQDGEDQVAYRGGKRYVARLVRSSSRASAGGPEIRADATYLVTGGLGSLGLAVAQWLVEQGAKHLVLVGRQGPRAAAQTVLAVLAQQGARVVVRQADVARAEEVQALLADLGAQPPLRGIIHAAGVLDDGVLLQQTWERFAKVLAPKALGAWHLHRATEGLGLDFFVLFSSVASVLGSAGQGNYAAANAALDGVAWYRRGRGLPALSVNWGPWGEVGMAARLAEREQSRRAEMGVSLIPPALGVQALGHALASGAPQCTVLPVDWAGLLGRFPAGGEPPLFRRMAAEATRAPAAPTRAAAGSVRRQLEAAPPDARPALLLEYVRGQVAQVLGLDPARPPADTAGLTELGMDSLMAVELRNRLQSGLGSSLPSTLAFEYPTIEALAAHLMKDVLALATRRAEGSASQATTQEAQDLDKLSQEELLDSLLDELKEAGY